MYHLTHEGKAVIIHLTKTTGKDGCNPSAPGKYLSNYRDSRPILWREQDGYFLCV